VEHRRRGSARLIVSPRQIIRSEATQQSAGQTLIEVAKAFFAPVMAQRHIGITLQIDVGPEVFDAKHSNIHPLFNKV
jgi:5-carboxymethyl-2-hydroxymuconate isomerase